MIRFLLSLVLAIGLTACGANAAPKVEVSRPSYLSSVMPVQYLIEGGQGLRNGCTAFSINRAEHLWMTAAHCGISDTGDMYVNGSPAEFVEGYADTDVMVIRVPDYTAAGELYRRQTRINFGTEIIIAGHPFGYGDVFVTRGTIANPKAMLDAEASAWKRILLSLGLPKLSQVGEFDGFMLFNVAAAPGNSGSPVMDKDGNVVSVLQIGWSREFSPVSGGATYDAVKWFDRYFAVKGAR